MSLRGQDDAGYAMAVLLVAMSVAAIMMTVAMPVWKQTAQREKEEELVFRGMQYVRALRLFSAKFANAAPPNLDVLIEQRFLRKKYKDPITNDDFQVILAGQAIPGVTGPAQPGPSGRGATGSSGGTGTSPFSSGSSASSSGSASPFGGGIAGATPQPGRAPTGTSAIGTPGSGGVGGIMGVVSKSKDKSIRLYQGRSHYNEWAFINTPQTQTPGAGAGGSATPGRGGPGTAPGTSPFGSGIGGARGGTGGRGQGPGPGRGTGPGGFPIQPGQSPFQPGQSPFGTGQPQQPIQPGRGRGN